MGIVTGHTCPKNLVESSEVHEKISNREMFIMPEKPKRDPKAAPKHTGAIPGTP